MWKNNVAITNALAKSVGNFHYSLTISEKGKTGGALLPG
jgi:hypothetical protein